MSQQIWQFIIGAAIIAITLMGASSAIALIFSVVSIIREKFKNVKP
jgi:hypothetical protein